MLWDPLRSKWVAATPEEEVRQQLLAKMTQELGYPKSLISIERGIPTQPPLLQETARTRRFDILAYVKREGNLVPLLLVECKAGELKDDALQQANGYNYFLTAPFICLAGKGKVRTFWKELDKMASVPFLPSYSQLVASYVRS
jgi:hypothetical protein